MNRIVEFRGMRADNKQWVYGYYYEDKGYSYILVRGNELQVLLAFTPHIVIPESVGQYTGLRDKHSKMIFEGDMVYTFEPNFTEPVTLEVMIENENYPGTIMAGSEYNYIPLGDIAYCCEVVGNKLIDGLYERDFL